MNVDCISYHSITRNVRERLTVPSAPSSYHTTAMRLSSDFCQVFSVFSQGKRWALGNDDGDDVDNDTWWSLGELDDWRWSLLDSNASWEDESGEESGEEDVKYVYYHCVLWVRN